MDKSKLVPEANEIAARASSSHTTQKEAVNIAGNTKTTPPSGEINSTGMSLVRRLYEDRGFSKKTTDIILQSWRHSSQKQ
jgi:hypothetical protein